MTAEERVAHLGFAVATYPDDALVEVYRSEIATAIRAAEAEVREACARAAGMAVADFADEEQQRYVADAVRAGGAS